MRVTAFIILYSSLFWYSTSKTFYKCAWYSYGKKGVTNYESLGPINPTTVSEFTNIITMQEIPKVELISNLHFLVILTIQKSNVSIVPGLFEELPRLFSVKLLENSYLYLESGVFHGLNITNLLIAYNTMYSLEDGVFLNMPSLRNVSLEWNNLEEWNPNAFLKTPNVNYLNLVGNDLKYLPADSFGNMKMLISLLLRENLIENLHKNAFRGLKYLEVLDLSLNRLVSLPQNVFSPLSQKIVIETLRLNRNYFSFLPEKILADLSGTKFINTRENPWKCSCYFQILKWANSNEAKVDLYTPSGSPDCIVAEQTCFEEISCDFVKDYYLLYPFSKRNKLLSFRKRHHEENYFQHLNSFCNISLCREEYLKEQL